MIYLDHGATTAVLPEVVEAMTPYFMEYYGNPSGHYEYGETSKKAIEQVRRTIADSLGAQPEEIYFTAEVRRVITGRFTEWQTFIREGILLLLRSSIMPYFILVSIWRKRECG